MYKTLAVFANGEGGRQIAFAGGSIPVLTSAMLKIKPRQNLLLIRSAIFLTVALLICRSWAFAQTPSQGLEEYFSKARAMEGSGNYAGAERVYQEAAKNYPNNPEVLKRLGIIYQTELKFPESIETFQHVLQTDPKYSEVNFYLGLSYFGLDQYDKAIAAFDKQLEIDPKYRRAHYFEAQVFQSLNRSADAMRQYEILLAQDPNDKKSLYQLIRFLKSTTLQAIDQLANLDQNSAYILVLRAESHSEEQEYDKAIGEYRQVLTQDPNFVGIHFALGEAYYNKVDYPSAEKELRIALQEDPNHPKTNYYLADILFKGGRLSEAVPLLELAVPADPNFMKGIFSPGQVLRRTGTPT